MNMMDLYSEEYAKEALEEAIVEKKRLLGYLEEINTAIFILNYFLATGEPLDPEAFGYDWEEEEDD